VSGAAPAAVETSSAGALFEEVATALATRDRIAIEALGLFKRVATGRPTTRVVVFDPSGELVAAIHHAAPA